MSFLCSLRDKLVVFAFAPPALSRSNQRSAAVLSQREGREKGTLPSGGERLAVNRKSLVANRDKAGSGAVCRGHLGGGWVGFQHASLVDAKVARSGRRNTATDRRRGANGKRGRGSNRGSASGEIVATLRAASELAINELLAQQTGHCSVIAVARG